ncbi:hypothetical protein AVDCRST_MAG84-745 [uncultured Microcoleus sp.]|uniref:Uncharacterized protein n=1 Tax=uncultured Microcoleus sp. TaxID=259945 RepID=A0A6J4KQ87_9CYAN|nr:hypothetical protein AVDCRST_MAG84-745 [uncultured Microcoleus sp.]
MVKKWLKASKKSCNHSKNRALLHPNLRLWTSIIRLMQVEAGIRPTSENTSS